MVLPGQVRSFNWTVRVGEYLDAGFFNVRSFRVLADALQYRPNAVLSREGPALAKSIEE
jgi:hypothetical protein